MVVKKRISRGDSTMQTMSKCDRCGMEEMVLGTMQSTGTLNFRPFGVPFLTFRTADIAVRAAMCPQCGHLDFFGDVEKLRVITQGSQIKHANQLTGEKHS